MTSLCSGDKAVGGAPSPPPPHSALAEVPTSKSMRGSVALREKKKRERGIIKFRGKHSYRQTPKNPTYTPS